MLRFKHLKCLKASKRQKSQIYENERVALGLIIEHKDQTYLFLLKWETVGGDKSNSWAES